MCFDVRRSGVVITLASPKAQKGQENYHHKEVILELTLRSDGAHRPHCFQRLAGKPFLCTYDLIDLVTLREITSKVGRLPDTPGGAGDVHRITCSLDLLPFFRGQSLRLSRKRFHFDPLFRAVGCAALCHDVFLLQ
jgi:hypothetical protein